MMRFAKSPVDRAPAPSPELVAAGCCCSWCGEPLGASTLTVLTAEGRRHASVMTVRSEANGRRYPRCQASLIVETFATVDEHRAARRRQREERRAQTIRRELQGLLP